MEWYLTVKKQERLKIGSDLTGPANDKWHPRWWVTCNQIHKSHKFREAWCREKKGWEDHILHPALYILTEVLCIKLTRPSTALYREWLKRGVTMVCFFSLSAPMRDGPYAAFLLWCGSSWWLERSARNRKKAINLSEAAWISPLWWQSTPGTNSEEC